MSYIADLFAERLGGNQFGKSTDIYKFARIKQAKAEARTIHPSLPLIDLGVGEPDQPADPAIVQILAEEAGKAENRHYADNGIFEFQMAAAGYLKQVFGVEDLDPATQILHGIGSKPILAMLPLGFINPGDVVLTTTPGYPILGTHTRYLGGEIYPLPLRPENDFYPDFAAVPFDILKRAKLLLLNYPNNPTGQVATEAFYQEVIRFARQNQLLVIVDAAYGALTLDGHPPLSFLAIDGAMEVGIEIHSLSKAFNMTGWRLAFAAGNPEVIQAYGVLKDNTDSGQFRAIQKAGVYALNHPELTELNCQRYSRRFDQLLPVLKAAGFNAVKPKASFYCYAASPKGTRRGKRFATAEAAAEFLIKEALISMVPWDEVGAYLRIAVTFEAQEVADERRVIEELGARLQTLQLDF